MANDGGEIAQVAADQGPLGALALRLPREACCCGILRLDELVVLHY